MSVQALEALKQRFDDAILETHSDLGDDTAVVRPDAWKDVCRFLRDDPSMAFDMPVDLCGVDYEGYGKVAASRTPYSEGWAGAPLGNPAPETDMSPAIDEHAPQSARSEEHEHDLIPPGARFAVVYHLLSVTHNQRLRVRVFCADRDFPLVE